MSKIYLVIFCLLATSFAGCLSDDKSTDVLPYEPGSAILMQSDWKMQAHDIYFQQFTAPSTGEYTSMTIITVSISGWCSPEHSGVLGAAIYSHNATYYGAGRPSELIAQGTLSLDNFSAHNEYLIHTIQFDDSADLKSNAIYWVAIASEPPIEYSCRLELGYYGGHYTYETDDYGYTTRDFIPPSNDYGLVMELDSFNIGGNETGFSDSRGFPTSIDENSVYSREYTYWYRIF